MNMNAKIVRLYLALVCAGLVIMHVALLFDIPNFLKTLF